VTDASGAAPISGFAVVPPGVIGGTYITVTITDPEGSTSEFSNCVQVQVPVSN
jgi:hypothetical protein